MDKDVYTLLMGIKEDIGSLKSDNKYQTSKLHAIEAQTIKTNGRVTKLEDTVVELREANKVLTAMYSKQDGIFKQNWVQIEEKIGNQDRQIDEFKKLYTEEEVGETEIKKINTENSWKLKLAIWGTISTMIVIYFTWAFTQTQSLQIKSELIEKIK